MIDPLLDYLQQNGRASHAELAGLTGYTEKEVAEKMVAWEADGTILGYSAVTDPEKSGWGGVSALIEVKTKPERGGGFDRVADRIARFDQVRTCLLMSGAYDLAVLVEGTTLQEVARFVTEKLSTLEGVESTATHFQLKTYKQNGLMALGDHAEGRLAVTP